MEEEKLETKKKVGRNQRKRINILNMVLFKNYLPYVSLFAFIVSFGVTIHSYSKLVNNIKEIIATTYSTTGFAHLIQDIRSFSFILLYSFLCLSFINFVFFLVYNHRTYGASYRIVKYIKEDLMNDNYDTKLTLRKGDFLDDIAEALRQFVEKLKNDKK